MSILGELVIFVQLLFVFLVDFGFDINELKARIALAALALVALKTCQPT